MSVIEINESNFKDKVSSGKVLVDCYAEWCGPCKMLSPVIEEIASDRSNISFYKLNIDENESICEEYNIVSIPTILVFEDGKLIEREVGFRTKDQIEEIIK